MAPAWEIHNSQVMDQSSVQIARRLWQTSQRARCVPSPQRAFTRVFDALATKQRDILFAQALDDRKRSPALSFGLGSAKVSTAADEHGAMAACPHVACRGRSSGQGQHSSFVPRSRPNAAPDSLAASSTIERQWRGLDVFVERLCRNSESLAGVR